MNKNKGVIYIVFGKKYIDEAILSASSVKQYCPDLHVTFFCDEEVKSEFVDDTTIMNVKHIRPKVDYIHLSPYEETILLDSDTIANHDISDLFDILKRYDLGVAHDFARKRDNVSALIPPYKEIPYCFSEVNPGVLVFKKCKAVDDFFEIWRNYFYAYFNVWPYEQPTFRVALWKSDLNFYILPPEYNLRSKQCRDKARKLHHEFGDTHLKERILHMHYDKKNMKEALAYCLENYYPH
jgi:hypothetical protein